MMKNNRVLPIVLLYLLLAGCQSPIDTDLEDDKSQGKRPNWYEVTLDFTDLPGVEQPETLYYHITVTGEDSALFVNSMGTFDYLLLQFFTSNWVMGLNDDANTLWQGRIHVGQQIVLAPIFQIDSTKIPHEYDDSHALLPGNSTDTTSHFWSSIKLRVGFGDSRYVWTLDPEDPWKNGAYSYYTLFYDYRTGQYTFQ